MRAPRRLLETGSTAEVATLGKSVPGSRVFVKFIELWMRLLHQSSKIPRPCCAWLAYVWLCTVDRAISVVRDCSHTRTRGRRHSLVQTLNEGSKRGIGSAFV